MATKKKVKIEEKVKKFVLAEVKRFISIITRYLPESKEKKEILAKLDEVSALVDKAVK